MINRQYKLVDPMTIEVMFENVDYVKKGNVLVRPTYLSVCKADLRYYLGQRSTQVLKSRLPLSLIHEAVGVVLHDSSGTYAPNTQVVLLPNIAGTDLHYSENYRLDSRFRSSRADGFMQEMLSLPAENLVPYQGIDGNVAAITEFISVGVHAVTTFLKTAKTRKDKIAVWGDGGLSYIVLSLLREYLPDADLTVIGINPGKLQYFNFADHILTVDQVSGREMYDHTFECVGGQASGQAISQMIDCILPEGEILLLGVSEEPVPVPTRMVLEKGLTLVGRSRSTKEDFEQAVKLLMNQKQFYSRMALLISQIIPIHQIADIHAAFQAAAAADFKIVLDWKI